MHTPYKAPYTLPERAEAPGPSGINARKEGKRPGGDITSAEARHFHAHSMK